MLFPLAIEPFTTLKNASTDAVTSALSTPVFSAISLMISALVTVLYFFGLKNSGGQIYTAPLELKINIETLKTIAAVKISVYNIMGETVLVIPNTHKLPSSIDVHMLSKGMYWLEITGGEKKIRCRFVKD